MFAVFPLILLLLLAPINVYANPIPIPTVMMTEEYINALIYPVGGEYWAYVCCRYPFRNIGYSEVAMKFPVPPECMDISVFVDNVPVYWSWSGEKYSTEIGEMEMITWTVKNPPKEFEVKVVYRNRLVAAGGEHVFLYALGTGRYAEYYSKELTAHIRLVVVGAAESYVARLGGETIDSGMAVATPLTLSYDLKSGMFRQFEEDFIFIFNTSIRPSNLQFSTDKPVYAEGEPVTFWLHNAGEEFVTLCNSAPWMIVSANYGMSIVYKPVALQVVREVAPGETVSWTWNQKNNGGEPVEPGLYAVVLEAGGQRLIAPFTIRKTVEFPGRLNVKLRLYPEKATVRLDALLKKRPEPTEPLRNLTVRVTVLPRGEHLTGTFHIDGQVSPEELEKLPLHSLSLHVDCGRRRGGGNITASFNPSENLPVRSVNVSFSTMQMDTTLVELNVSGTAVFSRVHLKDETARMLEIYAATLSTPAGMEMARHKIEEMTNGSIKLKHLTLSFSRETCMLNVSVTLLMNMSALKEPPSMISRFSGTAYLQWGVTRPPLANLTKLKLNAGYDGEMGVFSGDMTFEVEGNESAMMEEISNSIVKRLISKSSVASTLSGWLRNFRVGIYGRFIFKLKIPANTLQVSGITLRYKKDPSETSMKLIEAISSMPAPPRNVVIMLEAGSNEYGVVKLKLPSGMSTDRILISGNASALRNITYTTSRNPWGITDYKIYMREAMIGGRKYQLLIATNSTLKEVMAETGRIILKVEGTPGLRGGLNLTFPRNMLDGADLKSIGVLIDGEPAERVIAEKNGKISILVTYPQQSRTVEVEWTLPCPYGTLVRYEPYMIAGVAAAIIIAIIIIKRHS
ncbi:hypothetical protein DRO64_01555 [Candidatus Bathyarchaeota archaeon]|nr:MAG: hypothetical protein DRO64_01555 [Candidatus Bathyarchaeota archaeon]